MPRDKEAFGWLQFWRYVREVLSEGGWPPLWEWLTAILSAVVGLLVDRQLTDTWSWAAPLAAGLGMGLIVYAIGLIRAAARIDRRQKRHLRTLAGELTTDEVRRANQDRKQLQRLAHDLFNAWIDFQNATSLGGEEAMFEAEKRLKHGVNALLSLASSTDHRRGTLAVLRPQVAAEPPGVTLEGRTPRPSARRDSAPFDLGLTVEPLR